MIADRIDARGPLAGLRVIEFASIGPGPHCAMLLSDLGAEVLRIDREGGTGWPNPVLDRGRATMTLDIRTERGRKTCLEVIDLADVLIEGFRPGVMERLELGPDVVLQRNPRLVYGRVTGWGQTGPLAHVAGHDINYIAVTGALAAIGRRGETATPPLNLVGDFGGGSMLLAFGLLAALWEREHSGLGQIVDAAMVDGVSSQMAMFAGLIPSGRISMARDRNPLAGEAPFYRCYRCADGNEIAVGAIERHFYAKLVERIGAPAALLERQDDPEAWLEDAKLLERIFAEKPASEWVDMLGDTDCCVAPVVPLEQAPEHPQLKARGVYTCIDGTDQVAPVPRFSRSSANVQKSADAGGMMTAWRNASRIARRTSGNDSLTTAASLQR